jgi:OOP family OmpA-OmpF porin
MKTFQETTMKTFKRIVISTLFVASSLGGTAFAQNEPTQGYGVDSRGAPVMNSTGLCWHTTNWTSTNAVEPCDATPKPVAMVTPPPAPLAKAAEPAPVATVAAMVPVTKKISFSGDALFDFDKSSLKPAGMKMLDELVQQFKGAKYDSIVATGHSDRLGNSAYNQKLSERRAQTVKQYLMDKNVQAGSIEAKGMGETQPLTPAGACRGAQSSKVVACLQVDRRVDVEVTGTHTVTGSL